MEKTSQSKIVGFKNRKQVRETELSWLDTSPTCSRISQKDVIDLETLPISPDILKTTPIRSKSQFSKSRSYPNDYDSPQFKVGWNDGSSKSDFEMNSPISTVPIQRKIRRYPDNFMSNLSSRKASQGNNCDILQCIDWAKNLIGSSSTENADCGDSTKFAADSERMNDDTDDSIDELMVLCSQAVEESISSVAPVRSRSFDMPHKRHFTFENNEIGTKRMRPILMSNNRSKTEEDIRFTRSQTINDGILMKGNNQTLEANKNQNVLSLTTAVTKSYGSSNNVRDFDNEASFTYDNGNSLKQTSCLKSESKTLNTLAISSKALDFSVSNRDTIESQLNEDNDIFSSLDFNFVDSLQKSCKTFKKPSKLVNTTSVPQSVVKYTKEQIEKRRLEAKKRLLSKRKLTV